MKPYILKSSELIPGVIFDPDNNNFEMTGSSRPEDVRDLYSPMVEWLKGFEEEIVKGMYPIFSKENPMIFKFKMDYFNSSSAKFLFDIFEELNIIHKSGFPLEIHWHFDEEDDDMREAGEEMQDLVEMEFQFIQV
ncbi:MAG: DUF1987 domain-containing protein [Bacteroidota bacterium]|nr:DUF1987 domain-containing protein [Bacteroidota bacterium]